MGQVLYSTSSETTVDVGRSLAAALAAGDVILLEGDLAAGKTTLTRGLVEGLGGDGEDVSSPTFVLIQSYPCASGAISRLHHVDLYRVSDRIADLQELGLDDILSDPKAVVAVEWPKNTLASWIPPDARVWRVRLTMTDTAAREIEIIPPTHPTGRKSKVES